MAGLPRSGSTVLSAILNQNPTIYASPQTELIGLLYKLESEIPSFESYKAGLLHQGYASVMHTMAETFYKHIDKSVIIDKNRGWGTPYNWDNLSPYVNPNGKVIVTMRPILEVLASFIKVAQKTQKATAMIPYRDDDIWATHYRDLTDAQVDNLMKTNGPLEQAIYSVANLVKNHRDKIHVVWFDGLLDSPKATMDAIYDFLGLDHFEHNFSNIKPVDNHDDLAGYGMLGLHDVNKKLEKPKTKVENYLSEYAIRKYGNALDFLDF